MGKLIAFAKALEAMPRCFQQYALPEYSDILELRQSVRLVLELDTQEELYLTEDERRVIESYLREISAA